MTVYTATFGGNTIYPSQLSYRFVSLTISTALDWPLETAPSNNIVAAIMDVNPATAGLSLIMPDATEASTGETVLFNNVGSHTFSVLDKNGNTICAPQSGTTFQIYLTNNSTVAGSWRAFQYGASVSATNAAALAGLGIKAIATTLNQSAPLSTFNSDYTAGSTDRAKVYVWNGGSGTLTLTSAAIVGNDWFLMVRNNGVGNLIVDPAGTEQINGGSTLTMAPGDSAIIVSSGVSFFTIGLGQDAEYAFTYISIDVAGSGDYTLSSAEQNKTVYNFTGTLTGDRDIIVPNTVQQYWVDNATSGSFILGIRTAGQGSPGITVAQGAKAILYSDGTNVVDADTATVSIPLTISQGGTGSTTASGARVNLGGTSIGVAVFTAANESAAQIALGLDPIEGGSY